MNKPTRRNLAADRKERIRRLHQERRRRRQMTDEELHYVLQTAVSAYKWVIVCNDPPPMSFIGEMGKASEIAHRALLTEEEDK